MGSMLGRMKEAGRHCQSPQLMNVLSLPDEMLASVLKYISFEDLREIRKVSSKIDSVARRYGMDKMKIDSVRIIYDNTKVVVFIVVMNHTKEYRLTHPPSAVLFDILKYIFSKIRGVQFLELWNSRKRKMSISNEVGEFLLGNDCKNITKLIIHHCDISINFDTMRRIMTKLKPKDLFINGSFTEFEFSDAVIEGIPFDCLELMNKPGADKPLGISFPYLTRLCSLKIPSILSCTIYNSTVSDLITLFKRWTKDIIHTVYGWVIEISKGTMSVDETKQTLAKLKCFEQCEVTHSNKWDIDSFHIRQEQIGIITNYWEICITITLFP